MRPQRKTTRLKGYDYSTAGTYFITICTKDRKHLLSGITVGQGLAPAENQLSIYGKIAEEQIKDLENRYKTVKIDKYVVMPNHIHLLISNHETKAGAKAFHLIHRKRSPFSSRRRLSLPYDIRCNLYI